MVEINLLPEEERRQVVKARAKRRGTFFSLIGLVLTALISVIVFGVWAMLQTQQNQLTSKIESLQQQIQGFQEVETLARVLKNKLQAVSIIKTKSANFENLLQDVASVIPAGVVLSDLTVTEQNLITLSGSAVSASEFSSLVSGLLRANTQDVRFSDVTVESVTRDDKGIYKFSISAKLKTS